VKVLALYKRAIEELGLRQLDVYRVRDERGVEKDIVRIFDPASVRVITVDLGAIREALKPTEYLGKIFEALDNAGIPYPERKANELMEAFRRLEKPEAEAAGQA